MDEILTIDKNGSSRRGKGGSNPFKVLDRYRDATLIELELETGRTHQIRVHMAYIGHPVLMILYMVSKSKLVILVNIYMLKHWVLYIQEPIN